MFKKQFEVGRLQDLVFHASKQNQQLRWNEEAQEKEIQRWTEQALSFKHEAARLSHIQSASNKEKEAMEQEAHRVFTEAETSNAHYEQEALRLREHLATVMLAGKAIEERHQTMVQELAESKVNLIGCNDCGKFGLTCLEHLC